MQPWQAFADYWRLLGTQPQLAQLARYAQIQIHEGATRVQCKRNDTCKVTMVASGVCSQAPPPTSVAPSPAPSEAQLEQSAQQPAAPHQPAALPEGPAQLLQGAQLLQPIPSVACFKGGALVEQQHTPKTCLVTGIRMDFDGTEITTVLNLPDHTMFKLTQVTAVLWGCVLNGCLRRLRFRSRTHQRAMGVCQLQ